MAGIENFKVKIMVKLKSLKNFPSIKIEVTTSNETPFKLEKSKKQSSSRPDSKISFLRKLQLLGTP